jgi:hypothetical protein
MTSKEKRLRKLLVQLDDELYYRHVPHMLNNMTIVRGDKEYYVRKRDNEAYEKDCEQLIRGYMIRLYHQIRGVTE